MKSSQADSAAEWPTQGGAQYDARAIRKGTKLLAPLPANRAHLQSLAARISQEPRIQRRLAELRIEALIRAGREEEVLDVPSPEERALTRRDMSHAGFGG